MDVQIQFQRNTTQSIDLLTRSADTKFGYIYRLSDVPFGFLNMRFTLPSMDCTFNHDGFIALKNFKLFQLHNKLKHFHINLIEFNFYAKNLTILITLSSFENWGNIRILVCHWLHPIINFIQLVITSPSESGSSFNLWFLAINQSWKKFDYLCKVLETTW